MMAVIGVQHVLLEPAGALDCEGNGMRRWYLGIGLLVVLSASGVGAWRFMRARDYS
jgi:hypothetical protein